MRQDFLQAIQKTTTIIAGGKFKRIMTFPFRYWKAHVVIANGIIAAPTFFDSNFKVRLPASKDIYLFGLKPHASELGLTRFLIHQLKAGDHFMDIGAHYGFYSGLAAALVTTKGKVLSIEASDNNFEILQSNAQNSAQITIENCAVSHENGTVHFHQFPVTHSENNSILKDAVLATESVLDQVETKEVLAKSADQLIADHQLKPKLIKIDVEGAEPAVIEGMAKTISELQPTLIIEYNPDGKYTSSYSEMVKQLLEKGYSLSTILTSGETAKLDNLENCKEESLLVFTA